MAHAPYIPLENRIDPPEALVSSPRFLIDAYQVSQSIAVMATLGVADALAVGHRTANEIATAVGAEVDALNRLLHALAIVDLVSVEGEDAFQLTPTGKLLCSNHSHSLRSWAIHAGQPSMWAAWSHLLYSVQTGEPAFPHVHGMEVWDYREQHPAAARAFADAMASSDEEVAAGIAAAYDFEWARVVVDIGGGRGALLASILARYPSLHGILLELPVISDRARTGLDKMEMSGRCRVVDGDFFESVPVGGDVYILKGVLHDWDDEHAQRILLSCRRGMGPGSVLLVIELVPDNEAGQFTRFLDLHMMVIHGGRERIRDDFRRLLHSAGFELRHVIPTAVGLAIIEAVPDEGDDQHAL